MTAWTEHVKEYAKKHNLSYGCAMTEPNCKASYQAKKPQKLNKKEKKEVESMGAEEATGETNRTLHKKAEHKKRVVGLKAKLGKKYVEKELVEKFPAYAENKQMGAEDRDAPAPPSRTPVAPEPPAKKKAGRPKKYATSAEAKEAKKVKTVESNRRKRAEKKGAEAPAPAPAKAEEAQALIPTKKMTQTEFNKIMETYKNSIEYWWSIVEVFDTDFVKYPNKRTEKMIKKERKQFEIVQKIARSILLPRFDHIAKANGLKFDEEALYYDYTNLDNEDYYNIIDVNGDGEVGKTTVNDIITLINETVAKYKSILETLGISREEAIRMWNNSEMAKRESITLPEDKGTKGKGVPLPKTPKVGKKAKPTPHLEDVPLAMPPPPAPEEPPAPPAPPRAPRVTVRRRMVNGTATIGRGVVAGHSGESTNGLSHIYPLSHDNILKMLKHLL